MCEAVLKNDKRLIKKAFEHKKLVRKYRKEKTGWKNKSFVKLT